MDEPRPSGTARRYLMCPPTFFAVRYSINPWMRPAEPVDAERAVRQWRRLRDQLVALGHRVEVMTPDPALPDLVFTANGGIVVGDRGIVVGDRGIVVGDRGLVPRFRHAEPAPASARIAAPSTRWPSSSTSRSCR